MTTEQTTDTELLSPVTSGNRLVSALIDYIPAMMISVVINTIVTISMLPDMEQFMLNTSQNGASDAETIEHIFQLFGVFKSMVIGLSIALAISCFYFLSKDFFGGRSIGKRVMKLQLVMKDGHSPVSGIRMIVRNLFLVLWPVEVVMYLANSGQRLGDLLCKTTVVRASDENKQAINTKTLIVNMLIVAIFVSLISLVYYWGLTTFFDWYINFLRQLISQQAY